MEIPATGNPQTDALVQALAPALQPALDTLGSAVTKQASDLVAAATGDLKTADDLATVGLATLRTDLDTVQADFVGKHKAIEDRVAQIADQFLVNAAKDVWCERIAVGAISALILLFAAFWLAGSTVAADHVALALPLAASLGAYFKRDLLASLLPGAKG